MKISELLEGARWNSFKKSFHTGFEKTQKAQQNIKRNPLIKAAKGLAKFATNVNKAPPRS